MDQTIIRKIEKRWEEIRRRPPADEILVYIDNEYHVIMDDKLNGDIFRAMDSRGRIYKIIIDDCRKYKEILICTQSKQTQNHPVFGVNDSTDIEFMRKISPLLKKLNSK